ncbi:MAG: DUF3874 domain-containing protein [Prevotella sp.]|nr:DUF3874 domain-containing protein [Prevotella sp.]
MKKSITNNNEALSVLAEGMLIVRQFLDDNYTFRRNVLNGKVEFSVKDEAGKADSYRTLTDEALNSIIFRASCEISLERGNPQAAIRLYTNSEEIPLYNPIADFLGNLPRWDGHNHVADLFSRLPGVDTERTAFLAIWLRSAVAHWLQMDMLHGNECVPTLIGSQGCGKTTFLRRLLPVWLREYYMDHLNLSNKFDKEMALTNNLLVNIDELDAIRPSQHAELKQTLSKSKVNGRPIFGTVQQDRPRFASFVATTNNPHPLTDVTGSRRYLCITIPDGQFIDNTGDINYEQLYAQVLYEVLDVKAPYWFNNEEVARIQTLNLNYMQLMDMDELVEACFRKPMEGEFVKPLSTKQMLERIHRLYPSLTINQGAKVHLGTSMKNLGYEKVHYGNVVHYQAVPLEAA